MWRIYLQKCQFSTLKESAFLHHYKTSLFNRDFQSTYWMLHNKLHIEQEVEQLSDFYVNLLVLQSKICFQLRKYNEVEILLENAYLIMEQLIKEDQDPDLLQNYQKLKYLLIQNYLFKEKYICISLHSRTKDPEKINTKLQPFQLLNMTDVNAGKQLVDVLTKEVSENYIKFQLYHNLAVLYLGDYDSEQCIVNCFMALSCLQDNLKIRNYDELIKFLDQTIMLNEQHITSLVLLAETLLSYKAEKQKKLGLKILRFIKINSTDIDIEYFKPQIQLLYCAYFYDTKKVQDALLLAEKILNMNTEPFMDCIKLQALKIQDQINQKKQQASRGKTKVLEDQIMAMEEELNISDNALPFSKFYTPMVEFFQITNNDLEEPFE